MAVSLDYSNAIVLETEVATDKNISHGKLEKNILKHLGKKCEQSLRWEKYMELPVLVCWKHNKTHMHYMNRKSYACWILRFEIFKKS